MTYHLHATDAEPVSPARGGWTRTALPARVGDCQAERVELGDGLALVLSSYAPLQDLAEESVAADGAAALVITHGLAGGSAYACRDGQQLEFAAGQTTVAAFRGSAGVRRYHGGQVVRQLRVIASEGLLARYLGADGAARLLGGVQLRPVARVVTSRADLAQLSPALQPGPAVGLPLLDLQMAALGVLARHLRSMVPRDLSEPPDPPPAGRVLSARQLAQVEQARDLMAARLERSLTIAQLGAAVGLNEFTLKLGFRQCYGTSVHRLLTDLRMARARVLLAAGCQVAQVAWQVGFAHPANFSAAFRKYHGHAPKAITKTTPDDLRRYQRR